MEKNSTHCPQNNKLFFYQHYAIFWEKWYKLKVKCIFLHFWSDLKNFLIADSPFKKSANFQTHFFAVKTGASQKYVVWNQLPFLFKSIFCIVFIHDGRSVYFKLIFSWKNSIIIKIRLVAFWMGYILRTKCIVTLRTFSDLDKALVIQNLQRKNMWWWKVHPPLSLFRLED